jgi:hypothetical protein
MVLLVGPTTPVPPVTLSMYAVVSLLYSVVLTVPA